MTIDRTNDVPPPHDELRTCRCEKLMIPRVTSTKRDGSEAIWHWWCGCGHSETGGTWHPVTQEEAAYEAWERANAQAAQRAAMEPGRTIPANCEHERKTIADGGWTCDDCGRAGTIAAIGDHMRAMPPAWRRKWCEEESCKITECTGCASGKGGLRYWGFTKEQHAAWMRANPTGAEIAGYVDAAAAEKPDADGDALAAMVLNAHAAIVNVDAVRLAAHAHTTARGRQEVVPVFR